MDSIYMFINPTSICYTNSKFRKKETTKIENRYDSDEPHTVVQGL